MIIYANRTTEQLDDALSLAKHAAVPVVVLSTDIRDEVEVRRGDVAVEYVANSSRHTHAFMQDIVHFFNEFPDWHIEKLIEYHQSSKRDVSGTALEIVASVAADASVIESIRDDLKAQKEYGVLAADGYAVHRVECVDSTGKLRRVFELVTQGRQSYADGAIEYATELISV